MPKTPHVFIGLPLLAACLVGGPVSSFASGTADEDDPFLPGLVARYKDNEGHTAVRIDRQLAFQWGPFAADPRLTDGAFTAHWNGHLLASANGDYRFFIHGTGEFELKIDGRQAIRRQQTREGWLSSATLSLTSDYHALELSFRRTDKDARLMLLWLGPDFGLEPIAPRFLFHPREKHIEEEFERGRLLAYMLRCDRCHGEASSSPPAPALDRLSGQLSREWLVGWLTENKHSGEQFLQRRMPAFDLTEAQAQALADWLLSSRESELKLPANAHVASRGNGANPDKAMPAQLRNKRIKNGERLFVSVGCLACHNWKELGSSGWLGGGDLTHIAEKRPPGFFSVWLAEPARLNPDHRMPIFSLSEEERSSLAFFLAEQKENRVQATFAPATPKNKDGRKLAERFGCASCHRLPENTRKDPQRTAPRIHQESNWDRSCAGPPDAAKDRPGYRLGRSEVQALRRYYAASRSNPRDGSFLLVESNCLACHAREGLRESIPDLPPLLSDKLAAVAERYPSLAPSIPALTPPALHSVGDKLTDAALVASITRSGEPHRPYLRVRMPRFRLSEDEINSLVRHFIDIDRVPPHPSMPTPQAARRESEKAMRDRYELTGGRLVSSDGFGCTSCHAVGRVQPASDSLNSRGPDLLHLGRRIRRVWFDRWVRNPARIVPRMEMPSVQIPVSGVLEGKLDEQLNAVWHVLNLPGFEPPLPNPLRTLRQSGSNRGAEPIVLTDILQQRGQARIKPFFVGLTNRHNMLFDLETGALAQWRVGDVAHQHTSGKAWFWEPAGTPVLDTSLTQPDLSLILNGRELPARPLRQFVTEADAWQTDGASLELHYRLKYADGSLLRMRRKWSPSALGFTQELSLEGIPAAAKVRLFVRSADEANKATRAADGRTLHLGDRFASRILLVEPSNHKFEEDAQSLRFSPDDKGALRIVLHYQSEIPVDVFPGAQQPPGVARKSEPVDVAPGFRGERLPLPPDIMPTGISWRPDGRLIYCSLRGQIFEAIDTDHDEVADHLNLLADGLPAPYGIHADSDYIDISAKYALLRLRILDKSSRRMETVASGWGFSADYHDWAVGLPRDERGDYFLGLPCQQDKRSSAAARFHGNVLRLAPRKPTLDDPRLFALTPISAGHRFPMGLALDRAGELFVTDNQGNYKPFNELNHVRRGAHFGFINSLERGKPVPSRTPSAIDIPHPWTRSVNGICFLYTPKELRSKLGHDIFGPLEGHLIGCEYDTRRLIRMTLQRVGDTFQGAAYPLSIPPNDPQRGFLGPLICAVSPKGELYVGSIRDSGWGAGANIGEIVRIHIQLDQLPCGIAEVRATHDGFSIDFFRPIDRELAGRTESYSIQSYRREPTPAYGGPDRDRRTERVTGVTVSSDARRVTLRLAEMRAGFVYEMRLKNLDVGGGVFHPAEAHYTLNGVPR